MLYLGDMIGSSPSPPSSCRRTMTPARTLYAGTASASSLNVAVIAHKRHTIVRLRDEHVIDDTVLRRIQSQLDLEEVRLTGRPEVD
jgi:hypothetical protein